MVLFISFQDSENIIQFKWHQNYTHEDQISATAERTA